MEEPLHHLSIRGLRSIVEKVMMDLMYEVPSQENIESIVITPGVIDNNDEPIITYRKETRKKAKAPKQEKLA